MAKKHIKVNQINVKETNVPKELITKLYNFIKRTEYGEEVWDAMDIPNILNSLKGSFKINGFTYEEYVNKINEYFEGTLTIESTGYYILFEDMNVLNTLLNIGLGDGVGITKEQAKSARFNPWDMFKNNTEIEFFNEFKYFTDINTINTDPSKPWTNRNFSFYGCTNLKYIDLSNVAGPIPEQAFRNCTSLRSVNNLSKCNYIGRMAFYNCSSLQHIDLSNILTLGYSCFAGALSLNITNEDLQNITTFEGNRDGGVFEGGNGTVLLNIENLDLPNCTTIGDRAFRGQTNIKTVNLENINSLGTCGVFNNCTQLRTAKVTGGYSTPYGDNYYINVTKGIFEGCTSLTSVELSNTLNYLPVNIFKNCTLLTTVNFSDFQENLLEFDGNALYKADNISHRVFYLPRCINFGHSWNNGKGTSANAGIASNRAVNGNKSFYLPKLEYIDNSYSNQSNNLGTRINYDIYGTSIRESMYVPNYALFSENWNGQHPDHSYIKTLYFKNLNKVKAGAFTTFTVDIIIINNETPPVLETIDSFNVDVTDATYGPRIFNEQMFWTTTINDGIYVPDSVVETYKTTPYFSNVISKIKPLSTCPRITIEQGMSGMAGLIEEYMNEK